MILLVDDERDVVTTLTKLLQARGYVVVAAFGGAEGVAALEQQAFALVLTDVVMPDVTGWDIGAQAVARGVPVLYMTGFTDSMHLPAANGQPEIIRKPFCMDELLARVQTLLNANLPH